MELPRRLCDQPPMVCFQLSLVGQCILTTRVDWSELETLPTLFVVVLCNQVAAGGLAAANKIQG
jgi:hypothetical protein